VRGGDDAHVNGNASLASHPAERAVLEDTTELLYKEHPDAYKPVEPVVASLVEAGLATAVAELVPVLTVKR
jgi:release factor H-coupled RctB family protein